MSLADNYGLALGAQAETGKRIVEDTTAAIQPERAGPCTSQTHPYRVMGPC